MTRVPVTAETSTVLGYPGEKLWSHLQWERGAYKDRCPAYAYLHVAACPPDEEYDGAYYRVRPKCEAGCVDVEQLEDGTWVWVYEKGQRWRRQR